MGVFLLDPARARSRTSSPPGALEWGPVKQVLSRAGATVLRAAGAPGRDGLDPAAVGAGEEPAAEPGKAA